MSRVWRLEERKCQKIKVKLSALSVKVSEFGRMALDTQGMEKYSDIAAEIVSTDFRAEIHCLKSPLFFLMDLDSIFGRNILN
jgi:hypothetical protein